MYGLSFTEALFVWAAVNGVILICLILLACVAAGMGPPRPKYFPEPERPMTWTAVEYGVEVEYTTEEWLEMLSDDGEALLESDKNLGKVYLPPLERRRA